MIAELLQLSPVRRALIAVLIAGATFPLSGVMVLEMNLITLRFALMHGALLGGAIAVILQVNPMGPTLILGAIMVWLIGRISRRTGQNPGLITAMLMTAAVAGAAFLVYRFNVPAKDTLAIIWGNVYALRQIDLLATIALALVLVVGVIVWRRHLIAVLLDREAATSAGLNEPLIYYGILSLVALTVAVAMRLVGALLLDVFILLPALAARQISRSGAGMFAWAAIVGVGSAFVGSALSLGLDIPMSTAVAIPALVAVFLASVLKGKFS